MNHRHSFRGHRTSYNWKMREGCRNVSPRAFGKVEMESEGRKMEMGNCENGVIVVRRLREEYPSHVFFVFKDSVRPFL